MVSYDDKRNVLHTKKNAAAKKGDAILIRAYHKIEKEVKQFGRRKYLTCHGTKEHLQGHVASRPDEIYYEGKYWLPGTTKKKVMVTYNHLPDDQRVYIPTMDILRGYQVPSACQRIAVKDTTAYHCMLISFYSSQTQEQVNNSDDDNKNVDENNNDNDNDNDNNVTSPPVIGLFNIPPPPKPPVPPKAPPKPPVPVTKKNKLIPNQQRETKEDEFCMQQTDKFFNKDFNRKTKIHKKMQTAAKIIKTNKTKAQNSRKKNHKTPISFATKVTFCLKYEEGMSNRQAWQWCHDMGFQVGKNWSNCHRWSQKGSAYWTSCIAKSGTNNAKFSSSNIYVYILWVKHRVK